MLEIEKSPSPGGRVQRSATLIAWLKVISSFLVGIAGSKTAEVLRTDVTTIIYGVIALLAIATVVERFTSSRHVESPASRRSTTLSPISLIGTGMALGLTIGAIAIPLKPTGDLFCVAIYDETGLAISASGDDIRPATSASRPTFQPTTESSDGMSGDYFKAYFRFASRTHGYEFLAVSFESIACFILGLRQRARGVLFNLFGCGIGIGAAVTALKPSENDFASSCFGHLIAALTIWLLVMPFAWLLRGEIGRLKSGTPGEHASSE